MANPECALMKRMNVYTRHMWNIIDRQKQDLLDSPALYPIIFYMEGKCGLVHFSMHTNWSMVFRAPLKVSIINVHDVAQPSQVTVSVSLGQGGTIQVMDQEQIRYNPGAIATPKRNRQRLTNLRYVKRLGGSGNWSHAEVTKHVDHSAKTLWNCKEQTRYCNTSQRFCSACMPTIDGAAILQAKKKNTKKLTQYKHLRTS